jgi:hypothetical protein
MNLADRRLTGESPAGFASSSPSRSILKEVHANKGWVMNRFGEFYPSTINIEMMDVYRPPC